MRAAGALVLLLLLAGCSDRGKAVSGTIEVDEAHVGPRAGGRVEKILAWEGDRLHEGQVIVQLDASELRARRDLAAAQIDTAVHDADAQEAQLQFLRDEARRQQDLLKRRVVSSSDAERADSSAKTQEKNVAAGKMRVAQARAQLADMDAQLAEMQVIAPADSILEVLSVKVGDVLPANREAATLLLTGHLWVRVYVPESWLGLIKLGEHTRGCRSCFVCRWERIDLWLSWPGRFRENNLDPDAMRNSGAERRYGANRRPRHRPRRRADQRDDRLHVAEVFALR